MELSKYANRKDRINSSKNKLSSFGHLQNKKSKHCENKDLFSEFSKSYPIPNRSSTLKVIITTSSGYASIFILLSSALILSSFFATLGLCWFMVEKQKLQKTCQTHLLKAQKKLITGAEQLIELNPTVKTLVTEKKQIEKALLASPTPYEKAALLAALAIVLAKMSSLKLQQKTIINSSEFFAHFELSQLRKKLLSQINDMEPIFKTQLPTPNIALTHPKLKVISIYKDPLLPEYKISYNYAHSQTLKLNFSLLTHNFFPRWIQLLQTGNFQWLEKCASHPEKGDIKWNAQIGEGKFLSNALSF